MTIAIRERVLARHQLVLLIEPEAARFDAVSRDMAAAGYRTAIAADGASGLRKLLDLHPDAVVVSLDLPDMSGWEVIERIRALSNAAVIITANGASAGEFQRALDLRVEGFIVKPFEADEVLARLEAAQSRRDTRERWVYDRDGLVVDWKSCEVFVDGAQVGLTSTEFRLLQHLVGQRGCVVSHDEILREVWGPEYVGERDRVKLYVWYLRQKIERDPGRPKRILTKRGLGYTFVG